MTLAALAAPAAAQADVVYCFNSSDLSCEDSTATSIQDALDKAAAEPGPDRVLVGPGDYDETPSYSSGTDPVELIGAGRSVTTIIPSDTSSAVTALHVDGPAGTRVESLGASLPGNDSASTDAGISLLGATVAQDVLVDGIGASSVRGVTLGGGTTLTGSTVNLPALDPNGLDPANDAVIAFDTGQASIVDSSLKGTNGVRTSAVDLDVQRTSIDAYIGAGADSGTISLADSLIDLGARDDARGFQAANFNNSTNPIEISATNVTIAGGGTNSIGAVAEADSSSTGEDSTVSLNSTIIEGAALSLALRADNGETATIDTFNSDYDPSTIADDDDLDDSGQPDVGITILNETARTDLAPGFGTNFHLSASSPLIDQGDPAAPAPGALDIDGDPRAVDGDNNCVSRRDVGSDEFVAPPPTAQFNSGPAEGGATKDSPIFGLASSRACAPSFLCSLDNTFEAGCTSPHDVGHLSDGPHSLSVQALGEGAEPGDAVVRNFTVDGTPPQTTINTGPSGPINNPQPTFSFSTTEPPGSFECKIDLAILAPCSGPGTHTPAAPLPDGTHTFTVVAHDAVNNPDPSPATRSFSVDATRPQTTIVAGPSGPTADARPSFAFSTSEPPGGFECRIDSSPFGACSGPGNTHEPAGALADGPHSFEVRAEDAVANIDDSPAQRLFIGDATAPQTTITAAPKAKLKTKKRQLRASFSFSSDDAAANFDCALDGGAFIACVSPRSYLLKPGAHVFRIRAADAVPNFDPTPASAKVKVKRLKLKKRPRRR